MSEPLTDSYGRQYPCRDCREPMHSNAAMLSGVTIESRGHTIPARRVQILRCPTCDYWEV